MGSGHPGRSGLIAPEAVEEGSCTESDPAPVQGLHTHSHTLFISAYLMLLDGIRN